MQKLTKILLMVIRIAIAALFIFSGFVKGVDPWGTAIKLDEYFSAFSMEWLSGAKYALSIALSSVEMMLGFLLLFNIKPKFTSGVTLLFITGFTALTLIIAIKNPVADCGCFGDAIKLSNWATFWKNVVLLLLSVTLFVGCLRVTYRRRSAWVGLVTSIMLGAVAVFVGTYSLEHLPLVDFLPYKTGVNIQRSTTIPRGESQGEYRTVLIYKNIATSEIREFEVSDTIWYDDKVWEFVDSRSEELKKGYTPPIESFSIFNREGDFTAEILESPKEVFIVTTDDIAVITPSDRKTIDRIKSFAARDSASVICLTSYSLDNYSIDIPGYNIDSKTLKTFIRAHKGLVVLNRGTILGKWNLADVPNFEASQSGSAQEFVVSEYRKTTERSNVLIFCGALILVMFFYFSRCKKY